MKNNIFANNKDDRGFSLIELIVSILIMSVITGMVVMFISSSRTIYRVVNTDAVVQGEAETVRRFIGELALEARDWGQKDYTTPEGPCTFIWIRALDNDTEGLERGDYEYTYKEVNDSGIEETKTGIRQYYFYLFLLRPNTNTLAYGKYKYEDLLDGTTLFGDGFTLPAEDIYKNNILTSPYAVLADYVTGISCTTSSNASKKELITINLNFDYDDHEYNAAISFAGRNKQSAGD